MKIGIVTRESGGLELLRRILHADRAYDVIWAARNVDEAVSHCAQQPADLVLLEMGSPASAAVEAVRRIMREAPCPILLVVNSIQDNAGPIFEAIGAGALDVITISHEHDTSAPGKPPLLAKLGMLRKLEFGKVSNIPAVSSIQTKRPKQIVLLGASAGGPTALASVLAALPGNFPAPVIIVQHIDTQFVGAMTTWLAQHCGLPVQVAKNREEVKPGVVYMAGGSDHLVLLDRYTLGYRAEPKEHAYRPSIDELFCSVARFWKHEVVAALLTGMGRDGAAGLRLLRDTGALTITQDRASSVVYGIPKAAAQMNAAVEVLPLEFIGARIRDAVCSFNQRDNV